MESVIKEDAGEEKRGTVMMEIKACREKQKKCLTAGGDGGQKMLKEVELANIFKTRQHGAGAHFFFF